MKKDNTLIDGEPWHWENHCTYLHFCCDCGLTHMITFDITGNNATLRFYKDSYATKKNRKEERVVVYKRKEGEKNE